MLTGKPLLGYNFKSLDDIIPHLEDKDSGTTSLWAQATSRRLKCFTIAGYPEISADDNKRYNSCIFVDPEGTVVTNYRKTFLFETDEKWASEGSGFFSGALDTSKLRSAINFSTSPISINTSLGCCMDLNPYKFKAPFDDYEFANHVLANESNLVIVPMAWLSSRPDDITDLSDPEILTLRYWIARLEPLLELREDREIIFVTANRTGDECGVTYAGTSAVVGLKKGKVVVYKVLGVGEENLMHVDVPIS